MLNKESEYTYVTSKDADVENGDFGKNVGVDIGTKKVETKFVEETVETEQPVPEGE